MIYVYHVPIILYIWYSDIIILASMWWRMMLKKHTMNAKNPLFKEFKDNIFFHKVDFIHCDFGGHKDVMEQFIDKRHNFMLLFLNQLYWLWSFLSLIHSFSLSLTPLILLLMPNNGTNNWKNMKKNHPPFF